MALKVVDIQDSSMGVHSMVACFMAECFMVVWLDPEHVSRVLVDAFQVLGVGCMVLPTVVLPTVSIVRTTKLDRAFKVRRWRTLTTRQEVQGTSCSTTLRASVAKRSLSIAVANRFSAQKLLLMDEFLELGHQLFGDRAYGSISDRTIIDRYHRDDFCGAPG